MAKVMEKESKTMKSGGADKELIGLLNQQVANFSVLHMKLHQHHWFVKGSGFFDLHKKFEELYDEASLTMDEIAERILALKGAPVSTSKEIAAATTLKEHAPLGTAEAMVKSLRDDYVQLIDEFKETMDAAEEKEDEGTHDMLNTMRTTLQKHVWMLDAYLNE
ncbi:Dps family protein [Paenibacillus puerhi]|uniref:Dps family protein n=1 Tax=Paenibacillus puerhi TaxID=2692622 RepID=UPI00135C58BC|nr:Dps family protein [Paenibacillus puerhi]